MTDDTIKINREMLREAMKRARIEGCEGCDCRLEEEIFGPKKPREFVLWRGHSSEFWKVATTPIGSSWETIRVREVVK